MTVRRLALTCRRLLTALVLCAAYAVAQTSPHGLSTLYSFTGPPSDGSLPFAGVVIGSGGVLYGTTYRGGTSGDGTVFSLTPPASPGGTWTEADLYSFGGYPSDGIQPYGGVVIGTGGVLYGTTAGGGTSGYGTVFSLSPPSSSGATWTETVIHSFTVSDGYEPTAGLVIGPGGVLYGTTEGGGTSSCLCGTVFSLNPPPSPGGTWIEAVLYSFTGGNDGADPAAGVVIGEGGVLYGTTALIQPNDGTVFSLTPPASPGGTWTETTLYNFTGGNDGENPEAGVVIGNGGVLYGTTEEGGTCSGGIVGCGTVFSLTPPAAPGGTWTETVIYDFSGSDGEYPTAGVVISKSGVLYGTSGGGTSSCFCGTVFSLRPPASPGGSWAETVLHAFTGSDGNGPAGLVIGKGGALYGTTAGGGTGSCENGCGTVFALFLSPTVAFSPASLTFQDQTVFTTSPAQSVTLTNIGLGVLTVGSLAASGPFAQTNTCGAALSTGASCTLSVTFTPNATGTLSGSVSVSDNATGSPQTLPLTGTGVSPAVTFSPASLTFQDQLVFKTSPSQSVTLTNGGLGILTVGSISALGPFAQTNTCGATLNPADSCTISVTFSPQNKGTSTGFVKVGDNAPGSPQTVPLTGTATYVELYPTSWAFGTRPVGTTSAPRRIALTNKGGAAVHITTISIAGANPGDFAQTNTCGMSVASGASCLITITFTPTATGKRTADVSIEDDGGGSPQTAGLSGTGT
jgi:uncharacterized repeat protein (TIGR03803 family)